MDEAKWSLLEKGLLSFQQEISSLSENQLVVTCISQEWSSPTFYNFLSPSNCSTIVIWMLCDKDNVSLKCRESLKTGSMASWREKKDILGYLMIIL